jgi:hypothetical protein
MSAYFMIAVEALAFAALFYYIFWRKPKPFDIEGDLWGLYSDSEEARESVKNSRQKCRRSKAGRSQTDRFLRL